MRELTELLRTQDIENLTFGNRCVDEFVDGLNIDSNIEEDYFNKAEEVFSENKILAFEYYKLAYENKYWLAPYKLGVYFEYGIDKYVKSKFLAIEFYKEAINRDDSRGYVQIAELVDDMKTKLTLWKSFFTSSLVKDLEYKLYDFINYNIDYRAIFLYKFQNMPEYKDEILEIISIIQDSLKRDYKEIIDRLNFLLADSEVSDVEEEIFNEIINSVNLIVNGDIEEYFISNEDMSVKLEKLIKRDKKWA